MVQRINREQWQNGVRDLRGIIPAIPRESRRIKNEVNQIQARVELVTEETREVLGISQSTIDLAVKLIEGVTGGPLGLEAHWRNRWPNDPGNVTPEQLLETSKNKKWNLADMNGKPDEDKVAFLDSVLVIATMRQALNARASGGEGLRSDPDEVARIKEQLRPKQEEELSPLPTPLVEPSTTEPETGMNSFEPVLPPPQSSGIPSTNESRQLPSDYVPLAEPPEVGNHINVGILDGVELNTQPLTPGMLRNSCLSAQLNLHQLRDLVMERIPGGSHRKVRDVIGSRADLDRQTIESITSKVDVLPDIRRRRRELTMAVIEQRRRFPEGDFRGYDVGNSVVVLSDAPDGGVWLRILGAISTDEHDDWRGGRCNEDCSISFRLANPVVALQILERIDTKARGWEPGTDQNFEVIMETIRSVFPEDAVRQVNEHMFHRQEIQKIVDLREKQTKS